MPAAFFATGAPAMAAVAISTAATQNVVCSAGVCEPTAADAVLNTRDLETMLAAGNVDVVTTGAAVQATNIHVEAALAWSAGATLSLDAFRSVDIDRPVIVKGTGGVAIRTNHGGSGGEFAFGNSGRLVFANRSSALTIDGARYTLVDNVTALASAVSAEPSGAFALARNYDAARDGTYRASPIATIFSGSFDGLGNTISNLMIDDPADNSYVGLFAGTAGAATLSNIKLTKESVTGASGASQDFSTESIGGLVGDGAGGTIARAFVSGTVSGGSYAAIGGVAGVMSGSVESSGAAVSVSGGYLGAAGGLVGVGSSIRDSYATGDVSGSGFVGGLVGFANGKLVHSFAKGKVTGADDSTSAGGLAGMSQSAVERSFATGNVDCVLNCGGLVGFAGGGTGFSTIGGSWAAGDVTSGNQAGGLVGYNEVGSISDSYATGTVSAQVSGGLVGLNNNTQSGERSVRRSYSTGAVTGAAGSAGGLIGVDQFASTIERSYWDLTTSGIGDPEQGAGNVANDPGIKGLSNTQLQARLPRGFNPHVWAENPSINGGLPYLIANPPPH